MSEILVNTTTLRSQDQPSVAAFRNGFTEGTELYFIAWTDGSTVDIRGQIVDLDGVKVRGEFMVNDPTSMNRNVHWPAVSRSNAGPVVAWIEDAFNPPEPRPHVKLKRFDREGQPLGNEIQVSTSDIDPKQRVAITGMIDGGFLVTWADADPRRRIRAQRFNAEGARTGSELVVSATEGFHERPIATRLVDGNYVIAWRSDPNGIAGGNLTFRILDVQGSPVVGEIQPRLSGFYGEKVITSLDTGRFVIAHVKSQGTSDIGEVKSIMEVNTFEPNGAQIPGGLTANSERGINSSWPAIAPLPGERFLLSWVQKSTETFSTSPSVRANVFNREGALGPELTVNTSSAGDRYQVSAASEFSGDGRARAFIAWADGSRTNGDTSDFGVHGRALRVGSSGGLGD